MTDVTRRGLVAAAAGTLALATPLRKPRAQEIQGITALRLMSPPRKLDLHFTDADGAPRSLADYAGKTVVLNLWATWCVPCVREMPALDDLAKLVARDDVVVLPVSSDRGGAAVVRRFYADHQIANLPVLLDPKNALAYSLKVRGIPTTLLINPQGEEVGWLEGAADWSSPDAVTVIRKVRG
ncbi:TlpA disulfide reductase family protein [Acidisphaera sp. L21]|uniref:TlpA family protein disulfide reductase n=1 Tax=Acidisphaera sp. L21 TaxID=1641851 RepID=UPI0020B15C29|nr:TlpA disulfide reductase family protein [Acidisphaera sp. L21]